MKSHLFKKCLAATAVATAVAAPLSANAGVLDAWQLNLSVLNGALIGGNAISSAANATNIDHLVINGKSEIDQTVKGGSALGQNFVDNGYLQLLANSRESGGAVVNLDFGEANNLPLFGYIEFTGLTGVLNLDSTITFNPGVGTVKLFVEDDGDLKSGTGNVLEIASYKVVAPSGGSNLDFFGGTAANATVDVTLELLSSFAPTLFANSSGDPLDVMNLHLVNVDSLLDLNFNPNPDNTLDANGDGVSKIRVQNAGQYNINDVPEPSTLVLAGLALLGVGVQTRRKAT